MVEAAEEVEALSGNNKGFYEPCWTPMGTPYGDELKEEKIRTFDTGATRDTDAGKIDYEGFLSPLVIRRFGEYMHAHREMPDGTYRDSDNWQQGFPLDVLMKSGWRHFMDWWTMHRGDPENVDDTEFMEEAICALLFNGMAYLHELLAGKVSN